MTLRQWCDNAWIRKIEPSKQEVAGLLDIADRELSDASLEGLSTDGRFDHAYAAVRALCEVALHASGYVIPKSGRHHERVLESIKFTLGNEWLDEADYFDRCRRIRHQSMYDSCGVAQDSDARALLESATRLREAIGKWLPQEHRALVDDAE